MEFVSFGRGLKYLALVLLLIGLLSGMELALAAYKNPGGSLSPSEQKWLDEHPEIVLAPRGWSYPFEFFDDSGTYRGVAADYIALLGQRLPGRKIQRNGKPTSIPAQLIL
ncbi:MAG: hypothetical protein L3J79_10850 [Candidatus Marinimicrobia bacterium]|nr:hypothetical protein [Candidatus Neomarinimicrobiota bacterium]